LGLAQKLLAWSEGTTTMAGWLGTAIYWMLIGALLGLLISMRQGKSQKE
jgi:hypothetical protein